MRICGKAAILCSLLILSTITSCSKPDESGKSDSLVSTSAVPETTVDIEDQRMSITDDLPEKDFGGYNFRIYTYDKLVEEYCPDEQTGDVINDSVYSRNKTVEERFNCKITTIDSKMSVYTDHSNAIKRAIMGGEDAFDLALEHVIAGPNDTLEHLYFNLYDIPYLNFEKPWWHKQTIDELTLLDQMYLGSNTIFYKGLGSTKVVYVNKEKMKDYGLEVPYQDVFDGTWTLDKLINMTKDVYEDLNGNAERDESDFYGYISQSAQNGFLVSCDIDVLKKTPQNVLEINVNSDKMIQLVEKLYNWYFETKGGYILTSVKSPVSGLDREKWQQKLFGDGNSLFAFGKIEDAVNTYRNSDVVYGILPQPKFDEKQENYRSFSTDEFFCVPITNTDVERTGVIIEALSAEGYKQIIPSYYEIALKNKFLHDDESVKVLDLINNARTVSFAYVYDNWEGFGHIFSTIFADKPTKDFSSFYAKRIKSAEKRITKIVDAFKDTNV